MKTLKQIYNPPAPTPAQIYQWSETLKFGKWHELELSIGNVVWGRETPGMITASSRRTGLMAKIRLKRPGATVAWPGQPIPAPIPCEPIIEGPETDHQREQMDLLVKHVRASVVASERADEWQAIKDGRKAVKAEVSALRRKAAIFDKKDGKQWREQAAALARFTQVMEVSGLRVCYWSARGFYHVAEFHTGQGIGVAAVKAKGGKKKDVTDELRNAVAARIAEVGLAGMIEALSAFPVVNYPGELPAGPSEMGLVS